MDRGILLLALLPLCVFCFDIYDFFSTPPPNSSRSLVYHPANLNQTQSSSLNQISAANLNRTSASLNQTSAANSNQTQSASLNQTQNGNDTVFVKFSYQCGYRTTALSIKLLVEENFPEINVTLSYHHPDWPKYITTKLISTAQVLIIMMVMAGKHILNQLGMPIPSWYRRLAAHQFLVIAIPWLLGSITINYLQNTEPFDVYFNKELVFCKLLVGRFPIATEMKEIIRTRLAG